MVKNFNVRLVKKKQFWGIFSTLGMFARNWVHSTVFVHYLRSKLILQNRLGISHPWKLSTPKKP